MSGGIFIQAPRLGSTSELPSERDFEREFKSYEAIPETGDATNLSQADYVVWRGLSCSLFSVNLCTMDPTYTHSGSYLESENKCFAYISP